MPGQTTEYVHSPAATADATARMIDFFNRPHAETALRPKPALAAPLLATNGPAAAQGLPRDITGQWSWPARRVTHAFSLENIKKMDDAGFSAELTWVTIDPKCALRAEPVTGRFTPAGLSFEARTKCDVAFSAQLARGDNGWQGKATTTSTAAPLVLDLVGR
jgi:hypothetical protein